MATATVVASRTETTTGNSGTLDLLGLFSVEPEQIRAQLEVTAASGTTPTLDVKLQDSVDGTNWNDLFLFTQATATTREVKNHSTIFARFVRVVWTVAGTTPSFTFNVKAVAR